MDLDIAGSNPVSHPSLLAWVAPFLTCDDLAWIFGFRVSDPAVMQKRDLLQPHPVFRLPLGPLGVHDSMDEIRGRESISEERRGAGRLDQSFGFPLPPLKFRTAGFPQYGFKWTVNSDLRRHPEA